MLGERRQVSYELAPEPRRSCREQVGRGPFGAMDLTTTGPGQGGIPGIAARVAKLRALRLATVAANKDKENDGKKTEL